MYFNLIFKIELSNRKTVLLPAGFELRTLLLVFDSVTPTERAIAHPSFSIGELNFLNKIEIHLNTKK